MTFVPAPGTRIGGKYRLERSLAKGGMGSVWVARHEQLDAAVAVKFMDPSLADTPVAVARFEREAKAAAQLSSPHVVRVQDFGVDDSTPYMVMELLRGEDLATRLDREGRLSLPAASAIVTQACKGLKVAHDAGLVHRDIKPRNVFCALQGEEDVIKIVDFGIARETGKKLVDERTASGAVLGSPNHMSPEQASGAEVDFRTDLWALGVIVYRAVTGRRPFEAPNVPAVMLAIVHQPAPLASEVAPDLPKSLDDFFRRALHKDPAKRFSSAREMADAFAEIAGTPLSAALASRASASSPDAMTPQGERTIASEPETGSRELGAITAASASEARSPLRTAAAAGALLVVAGAVVLAAVRSPTAPTAASSAPAETAAQGPASASIAATRSDDAASASPAAPVTVSPATSTQDPATTPSVAPPASSLRRPQPAVARPTVRAVPSGTPSATPRGSSEKPPAEKPTADAPPGWSIY